MKLIIIVSENFSPEYVKLLVSLIPHKFSVIINKDGLNDLYYNIDHNKQNYKHLLGIIFGTKVHEENENLRFIHISNLKNPFHLSIDTLTEYLDTIK